jgi:predicted ATP-dependent endonuclease of OLD family
VTVTDDAWGRTYERGKQNSLVRSFKITGLHGYRTVSISSEYAATILIAKNGSGKTTLLSALNAFLHAEFTRLQDIKFSEITCEMRDFDLPLVLRQSDVLAFCNPRESSDLTKFARILQIEPFALLKFLVEEYTDFSQNPRSYFEHKIFSKIIQYYDYRSGKAVESVEKLRQELYSEQRAIRDIYNILQFFLKTVEVVYLPTYRRIELPLNEEASEPMAARRRRPKFKLPGKNLFTGNIQFGLSDISERLAELNKTILIDSNAGYRQISADIINELLDGTFDRGIADSPVLPSEEELKLFFSRLRDAEYISMESTSIPNMEKIYTGQDMSWSSNRFLIYFLSKLNTVIQATRDIELRVEEFVSSCNKYLSAQDTSASLLNEAALSRRKASYDDKVIRLNRKNLKVHVESVFGKRRISLDALSSGEKQMVSLFASLFLYPKDKLVLIDEPELSLSIDWQRQILADVVDAPSCRQVIAITHSPFVFDNALESFARSLTTQIDINAASSAKLFDEEDSDV